MFYPKSPFTKCPGIESQIFQRNQPNFEQLLEWLCHAPKITTYRVNLMETTPEKAKECIQKLLDEKYETSPEIFFLNDIPEVLCISPLEELPLFDSTLNEVIVDNNCGSAILRGAHLYAPGVLAMNSGTKLDEHVNIFADLEGKCKKGKNVKYESNEKVFIGTGKVKMQRYQLFGKDVEPRGIAVEIHRVISGVPALGNFSSKSILLQNLPSIICCKVLDPKPKEIILDMCAAPGNKTNHIFQLIKGDGIIIAIDKINSKIKKFNEQILRQNMRNVYAFSFDSTKSLDINKTDKSIESIINGPPFSCETFDRILLDAPCSSLGNRPLLSCKFTQKMLKSYFKVQKKLFSCAVGLLKNRGILVYSTCTIHDEENEGIIVWAKDNFPNLKLIEAKPYFGGPAIENADLSTEERNKLQRFSLNNRKQNIDTIGFFIAKFIKIEN